MRPEQWLRVPVLLAAMSACTVSAATTPDPARFTLRDSVPTVAPFDSLTLAGVNGRTVVVTDGAGHEYVRSKASAGFAFAACGALGAHSVALLDKKGRPAGKLSFVLDARTRIADGGQYGKAFDTFLRTMRGWRGGRGYGETTWRGTVYYSFVHWMLDHYHTAKGMQYFEPHAASFVTMMREAQRKDGLIWSNVSWRGTDGYLASAHMADGYAWSDGGVMFSRQPVENHPEYLFVECLHLAWKGSGDGTWMRAGLDAAVKALDYGMNDRARWSKRFGLLKRGYTIDSWDFQIEDAYSVVMDLASGQRIDPDRTKFGVFYGDNTGYYDACLKLAEMLEYAGRAAEAAQFRQRAAGVLGRLDSLTWNGRYYRHWVEEDSTVVRDIGVHSDSQLSFSNAYSLNRGLPHETCVAIVKTYLDLKGRLPEGSPGEWYAVYPPFERGFGEKWQYMNGGVHGHAAGELARGAFEHGFESYAADILRRTTSLAEQSRGIVKFAYTGAREQQPEHRRDYVPVDLSRWVTMALDDKPRSGVPHWMMEREGNDLSNLPTGDTTLATIPWRVTAPTPKSPRAAICVGVDKSLPRRAAVPIRRATGALYLLHAMSMPGPSGVAALLTFKYKGGGEQGVYLMAGRHVANWWFPSLDGRDAGVAWRGENKACKDVGVFWATVANPRPESEIDSVVFSASGDGASYALLGLTLGNAPPAAPPGLESHGGPDNWSGGTCMAALVEGLAGVVDQSTRFRDVRLSPRWAVSGSDSANVVVRYPASDGYVAYRYRHDTASRSIRMQVTGSADSMTVRVLLPVAADKSVRMIANAAEVPHRVESVEQSDYAVARVALRGATLVQLSY
jgi:hypothetical protein